MKKILTFCLILLVTLFVCFSRGAKAQFDQTNKKQPLQLTIKSDKEVYEVGEEIEVGLKLTNVSKEAFYINTWIFPHYEIMEAIIQGPDGIIEKTIHIKYNYKMYEKDDFKLLAPRESYVAKLYSNSSPYHFLGHELKKPGIYTIAIIYSNKRDGKEFNVPNAWLGNLTSNTITIEVVGKGEAEMLPRMMKGWELYSWEIDNEWHFTLIPGTNRNKTYEEIISAKHFPGHTVKGIDAIKVLLKRLPKGEVIFWETEKWSGIASDVKVQLRKNNIALIYPSEEIISEIRNYCEQLGVKLGGLSISISK